MNNARPAPDILPSPGQMHTPKANASTPLGVNSHNNTNVKTAVGKNERALSQASTELRDPSMKELAEKGPSQQDLDRVVTKMRSDLYGNMEAPIDRASALAHAVLFDGDFESVYRVPEELAKVTPGQVRAFAEKYLVSTNRTIIDRLPATEQGKP